MAHATRLRLAPTEKKQENLPRPPKRRIFDEAARAASIEARREYVSRYNKAYPRPNASARIIGVDGEGQGRSPHVYNFLAAADENGCSWTLGSDPKAQLGTKACLDFLLSLPSRSLVVGYAFLYDLTKILEDLPDRALYLLFHPDRRRMVKRGKVIMRPVRWTAPDDPEGVPYRLNYVQRRFSVARGNRRVTVWDIFAFYQRRFTESLKDWKVLSEDAINRMADMKDKRSAFDAQDFEEIKEYCLSECGSLARLGRKLIDAHEAAGYPLRDYYGAGSTASSLMRKHEVCDFRSDPPPGMREAVACSFFGGRFENRFIGAIRRRVVNKDISSAYPYAATFLPCLVHGRWRFYASTGAVERAIDRETLMLVHWHLPRGRDAPWGPLPVRKANGTIAYPLGAEGGWTWKREFLQARRMRPDIVPLEGWGYSTDCSCKPFGFLPEVYRERCRIGKEGPGQVLKLGPNSVYGKLVQSIGSMPFTCWVWGSLITSSCRAQVLGAILAAQEPSDIVAIATDGIFSVRDFEAPLPVDTGTSDTGKPLGGWETKHYDEGMFLARPGVYFPLKFGDFNEDQERKEVERVKARGLGRRVLFQRRREVVDAFERGDAEVTITGGQRFIGAKSGIRWSPRTGTIRDDHYGDWVDWPIKISFDPRPKRRSVRDNGELVPWDYFDVPSLPYENALKDRESELLELAAIHAEEQPDLDFTEV